MSALGLSTMVSEAVLVRMIVPAIGERRSMGVGLACFAVQCAVLGVAYEGWHLFVCVVISMGSNLVYPSLTSLISEAVSGDMVGEALGAVNAVKALTGACINLGWIERYGWMNDVVVTFCTNNCS